MTGMYYDYHEEGLHTRVEIVRDDSTEKEVRLTLRNVQGNPAFPETWTVMGSRADGGAYWNWHMPGVGAHWSGESREP